MAHDFRIKVVERARRKFTFLNVSRCLILGGLRAALHVQLTMAINLFSGEGAVGNVVRNAVTTIASPLQPAPEVNNTTQWGWGVCRRSQF